LIFFMYGKSSFSTRKIHLSLLDLIHYLMHLFCFLHSNKCSLGKSDVCAPPGQAPIDKTLRPSVQRLTGLPNRPRPERVSNQKSAERCPSFLTVKAWMHRPLKYLGSAQSGWPSPGRNPTNVQSLLKYVTRSLRQRVAFHPPEISSSVPLSRCPQSDQTEL
jgi:hypothetical protein